jgi:hypothetical protein
MEFLGQNEPRRISTRLRSADTWLII